MRAKARCRSGGKNPSVFPLSDRKRRSEGKFTTLWEKYDILLLSHEIILDFSASFLWVRVLGKNFVRHSVWFPTELHRRLKSVFGQPIKVLSVKVAVEGSGKKSGEIVFAYILHQAKNKRWAEKRTFRQRCCN